MTTPIPPEAIAVAMASRAHDLADDPDPMVLSDETLTRRMLEAAAPHIAAAERRARMAEQDAMHADLAELLRALGMFDGARPQSPHEVMQEAIATVRGIMKLIGMEDDNAE